MSACLPVHEGTLLIHSKRVTIEGVFCEGKKLFGVVMLALSFVYLLRRKEIREGEEGGDDDR